MNAIADVAGLLPATTHTLRRTGHKPIRFEGWQLVEAIGAADGRPIWHDLNIYRTAARSIVVELIVRGEAPDHLDICRVKTFADLADAAAWLEAHPASDDVPIPDGLRLLEAPLPWAMLQAAQLRQRLARVDLDYRALLSEVFAALDLTDPAEPHATADRAAAPETQPEPAAPPG